MKTKLLIAVLLLTGTAHAQLWQDENGRQNPLFDVPSLAANQPPNTTRTYVITEEVAQQDTLSVQNVLGNRQLTDEQKRRVMPVPSWNESKTVTVETYGGRR